MANNQKKVEASKTKASSSGANTPAPAFVYMKIIKKMKAQQKKNEELLQQLLQQSSSQPQSQQSNSLTSKTTPPAPEQQIERPRQKQGLASDNKIKGTGGKPGSDKSGGGNCNKGKGPTNITNTGPNNINGCNKPQEEIEKPKTVNSTAPARINKRTNRRKKAAQKKKAEEQELSGQPLSQQSNSIAPQTTPLTPEQQIKRPRQKEGLAVDDKIKDAGLCVRPGNDKSGGDKCNKGKGPTNITNTGLNNINGCNKPQEEPAKRNIIYLTNRAKLAAQAELLAEAVPFRLPYNST